MTRRDVFMKGVTILHHEISSQSPAGSEFFINRFLCLWKKKTLHLHSRRQFRRLKKK